MHHHLPALLAFSSILSSTLPAADLLVADFEGPTYAPWQVVGEAFGSAPAPGPLPGQMNVEGFLGHGLANSFHGGDRGTGSLTSPEIRLERRFLSFLIGGGQDAEKLALQLWVDGKLVRSATGANDRPGGSETLTQGAWDIAEYAGKMATLRMKDEAQGSWGHLNVDHLVQTDVKPPLPPPLVANAERRLTATARYLHFPIKNGAPKRVVTLLVEGQIAVRNDIELADGPPDWWAPMDVSAWKGKTLALQVDKLPADSTALSSLTQDDSLKESENLYREALRGQFHFSPRRGWNNDPNGMVFYRGEYHLFFQHNPYGWGWGNMHWGHAVSKDMIHWEELGDKLLPDNMGPMFSGSAVVDWNNTSGFGQPGIPPLVLLYTAAGTPTVQGIAYSTDGRTFTKYAANPVLPQITEGNRDPKVIWHEPTHQWVMVLYVGLPGGQHTVHFFNSPNLRDWTLKSVSPGIADSNFLFECPDFFELPIDGDATQKKWVLLGANSEYAVGTFDGAQFQPEQTKLPGHRGRGFYAPQTFSDIPAHDGRRIQIGWFQTETKGMPFNQSMTVPLELKLTRSPEGPRMTYTPIRELESLRAHTHSFPPRTLKPGDLNPLDALTAELIELRAEIEPRDAREIVFNIRDAMVIYDPHKQELAVNGHRAPAPLRDGKFRLTLYLDRTGLEVFASDGLCYMPMPFLTKPESRKLFLETRGGSAQITSLQVHELRSAWAPQ